MIRFMDKRNELCGNTRGRWPFTHIHVQIIVPAFDITCDLKRLETGQIKLVTPVCGTDRSILFS